MSRALSRVRERFPGLEIRLSATTDDNGPDEVRRGGLDMVILSRYGVSEQPASAVGLREWILGSDPLRLCVPPRHRLAHEDEVALADLRDEPWIICPTDALGRLTISLCATAGFEPELAASVNDVGTAVGLAAVGWGITIAPELTPSNTERPVAHVPLAGVNTHRHSVLVVRDGDHLSPRVAAAVTAVREISAESWPAPN